MLDDDPSFPHAASPVPFAGFRRYIQRLFPESHDLHVLPPTVGKRFLIPSSRHLQLRHPRFDERGVTYKGLDCSITVDPTHT